MSWHRAKSPWQKQIATRRLTPILILGPILPALIILFSILHSKLLWLDLLLITLFTLALVGGFKSYQRYRIIQKDVPQTDGKLCPWCLKPLIGDDNICICPKCKRKIDTVEVERYWIRYALDSDQAIKTRTLSVTNTIKKPTRLTELLAFIPKPDKKYGVFYLDLTIWLGLAIFNTYIVGYRSLFFNLWYAFRAIGLFMGWALVQSTMTTRQGLNRFCATCEYTYPKRGDISQSCPECGAPWLEPGEYHIGQKHVSKPVRNLGIGMMIVWAILVLSTVDLVAFLQSVLDGFARIFA